jgi:hypothetical protein
MRLARVIGIMGGVMAGGGLALAAGSTCAANFNRNLGIWQDEAPSAEVVARIAVPPRSRDVLAPLLLADSVDAAAPAAKPKPPVRSPAPGRAAVIAPAQTAPTGAEIVGKSLSQGPSDPNVPLPHPNLTEMSAESASASRTRLFGRADPGDGVLDLKGGLFGLTVPIPADRNAPGGNTRYSPGLPTLEMGSGAR